MPRRLSPLSPQKLHLDFGGALPDKEELATVCLLATGWLYIWEARTKKKQVCPYRKRAEVEAIITNLRKTRYGEVEELMLEMIS